MTPVLMNKLTREADAMKPVDRSQRFAAAAVAVSMTFSIVWALAAYAYERPAEQSFVTIARR
jgi:hypothetical protein